jgi:hypothetical protein
LEVFYPYAIFFCNTLVYYMFSGGMPILWLFACLNCIISYITYKYIMIVYFRKCYNFDEEIPLYAISLLKYTLLMNCFVVLFMYTNKRFVSRPGYDRDEHHRPRYLGWMPYLSRRFVTHL